jgi:hypothetical protein
MAATVFPPKPKATNGTKAKEARSDRAEANRRNAHKSTGPRTAEGKARSRFNALKHGMTAESALLPGEDGEEFLDRQKELLDDLQPRNRLEEIMIERIARDDWMSIRAERAAAARVALRLRHDATEQALQERHEAIELGQRLLCHVTFPWPISPLDGKGELGKAPLANIPGDPHHPARLLLSLESTLAGCDWLLHKWAGLKERLEIPGLWRMDEGFEMIRLSGAYMIDIATSYAVQYLLLASLSVAEKNEADYKEAKQKCAEREKADQGEAGQEEPEPKKRDWNHPIWNESNYYIPPGRKRSGNGQPEPPPLTVAEKIARMSEAVTAWWEPFRRRLGEQPSIGRLAPRDVEVARQRLSAQIEGKITRIETIREELERIAELDAEEAPARLAFETGAEGDRQRRYVLSRDRLLNRTVDTFLKVRKNSNDGSLEHLEINPDDAIDPDDPMNVDNQDNADEPPGSDPVQDIGPGDPCDTDAPCDGPADADVFEQAEDDTERQEQFTTVDLHASSPAQGSEQEASCDSERILRNEANSPVSHNGEHREHEEGVDLGTGDPCAAGDSANGPSEAGDIVRRDSTTSDASEPPPARSHDQPAVCDTERILRNEANSPVSHHGEHREKHHEAGGIGPGNPCVAHVLLIGPSGAGDVVPGDSISCDLGGPPPARAPDQEASCDAERVLRNEANLT